MGMRDLKSNVKTVQTLAPKAHVANGLGVGVDTRGFDSAMAVLNAGLYTNGSFTFKLMESETNVTSPESFTAVAAGDLDGAFAVIADAADDNVDIRVGYKGNKRYLRVDVDEPSSPNPATGMVAGASIVLGRAHQRPVA